MAAKSASSPRFDPVQRLRHRFYEPLLLLWMLNPARGQTSALPTANQPSNDFFSQWREFLDSLSWLCDFSHGGKTVSAVAAESDAEGNRFWLACKHDTALPHLRGILGQLQSASTSTPEGRSTTARAIAETTIQLSNDKIRNYRRELSRRVKALEEKGEAGGLLSAVAAVTATHQTPLQVCHGAMVFPEFATLDRTIEAMTDVRTPTAWSLIRHYLMRLQTWHRKSAFVVNFAARYPAILDDCSCEWLQLPDDAELPKADGKTNLLGALKRMVPKHEQTRATQVYESVTGLRTFDLDAAFVDSFRSKDLSLVVHAEVHLMEYFYWRSLRFLDNDRYVGCSKRSCYCCSLYMRYHPGNFVVRPSHGTAWVTWNLPLLVVSQDDVMYKHTLGVMNRVIEHLRRDILNELEVRFPRRQRPPDSTSAFTSISC